MLLALLNPEQVAPLRFGQRAVDLPFQQLGVAEYRLQRGAELVAKQRQKIRLDAIGSLRFFAGFPLAGQQLVLQQVGGRELRRSRGDAALEIPIQLAQLLVFQAEIFIGEAIARLACFARCSAVVGNSVFQPGVHRLRYGEGSRAGAGNIRYATPGPN